ncbi:aldehyde dehydrogenase family protein [Nonomuraea africana]
MSPSGVASKGVDNSMHIAQEEIFGPVLVVIANDSDYGLS